MDHLQMGFIRLYPQFLTTRDDPPEGLVVLKAIDNTGTTKI